VTVAGGVCDSVSVTSGDACSWIVAVAALCCWLLLWLATGGDGL
jgi:hypothetical protein